MRSPRSYAKLYARRIVGWKVPSTMRTDFVLEALEQALDTRRPFDEGAVIHHDDRGSQYASIRYSTGRSWNGPPWSGWTGSTTSDWWSRSGTSRRRRPRRPIVGSSKVRPWRPNSNRKSSGNPAAAHFKSYTLMYLKINMSIEFNGWREFIDLEMAKRRWFSDFRIAAI